MNERFFPGFNYEVTKPFLEPLTIVDKKIEAGSTDIAEEVICLNDIYPELDIPMIEEVQFEHWEADQIQNDFNSHLESLNKKYGTPSLKMDNINMIFVEPDEMRPESDEERNYLIHKYGEYMKDGGDGDCVRMYDGTFNIRIGYKGLEDELSKEDVLSTMGHEYGHTLGVHIVEPVFEELKAYAFANLVIRTYYDLSGYLVMTMSNSTVHEVALNWFEQLLDRGISEEEILAHLTGSKFGNSEPNDYAKIVNNFD